MSHDESPSKSRSTLLAVTLLFLTFVTGAILGIAGDRFVLLRQGRLLPREGMQFMASHIARALDRELHLTTAQHAQIETILEGRRSRIESIWHGIRPQVRAEVDRTNAEISALLTSEQRVTFNKLTARWQARTERMMGKRD